MPGASRDGIGMLVLPFLWLGAVRMTATQADLFPAATVASLRSRREMVVLDRRRRGATFIEHRVTTLINSPESTGMGFWSINPYVGCEFGCTYCYARDAHRHVVERAHAAGRLSEHDLRAMRTSTTWKAFERHIFVKQRKAVLQALDRDLLRLHRRHDVRHPLVIGTATDPYQPAERRFGITAAILERLTRERGLAIGIITKSPTIVRDIPLLIRLQRRHRFTVYLSLISTDPDIIRIFEARSPHPAARLKALRQLTTAGVHAGLIVAPILPGITDPVASIEALAHALAAAGGHFAHPSPLRLYPALHRTFLPVVEQNFPALYPRYRRAYRGSGAAPRHYTEAVIRRFRRLATRHGIPVTDPVMEPTTGPGADHRQLGLWS